MMTSDEYREALETLDLTQVAAGELLQVGPRTSRRWALNEARIPAPVAMLLKLMVKKRLKLEVPVKQGERRRTWSFRAKLE